VLGATLLVIVIFVPGGLVGAISRLVRRVNAWVAADEEGIGPTPPPAPGEQASTAARAEGADA
jgi:hypothetical protein